MNVPATLSELFSWTASPKTTSEIPELFPMPLSQLTFITTDVVTIYSKILTDVLERIHGLNDDQLELMWDNCVKSNKSDGLITMLAKGMTDRSELFIVYDSGAGILRHATGDEQNTIRADYEKMAVSTTGVYISFKEYQRSDMIKLYSALEYLTISALNRSLNISTAPQFKFSDIRASVAGIEKKVVEEQAQAIAKALMQGKPIMLDAKDSVETATPELEATQKSIDFIASKLSFYLGLPTAYITGEQTGGIGSTGENDMRAVERGLKSYYFSVLKPALEAIFDVTLSYKSQDFRNMAAGLEVLKAFSVTDEEFISAENKLKIINQVFDLPEDAKGDPVQAPPTGPTPFPPRQPVSVPASQVTQ